MADSLTITSTVSAKEHVPHEGDTLPSRVTTGTGTVEDAPPGDNTTTTTTGGGGGGTITTRAFCFMAVGGSIGAGLFVASGTAVRKGGPAAVVIAFLVLGIAVWLAMCALGELAASVPARGSFYGYSLRFVSESWGFAMGWNYVLNFVLIVAFEMTVIVMLAQYWRPGLSVLESRLFLVVLALLPLLALHLLLGGKGYSEAEMGFSVVKVGVLALFMVVAIVIATGGTPEAGGRGFENYMEYVLSLSLSLSAILLCAPQDKLFLTKTSHSGNALRNGCSGFLSVFVAAGMAYGGTEMLGLSVAECQYPRKVMPLGSMIVVGRILFCYVLSLFFVGLVVKPSDFDRPEFAGLHVVSPFVVAVRVAGLPGLATFINVALILAVLSMANASVFASSRAMAAICREGMGPALLGRDARVRWGVGRRRVDVNVPRNALIVVGAIGCLAWIVADSRGAMIFEWLLSLASLSNYFTVW